MSVAANHKLLGVVFLALLRRRRLAHLRVFTKKFTDYDEVTLQTADDRPAAARRADVKSAA